MHTHVFADTTVTQEFIEALLLCYESTMLINTNELFNCQQALSGVVYIKMSRRDFMLQTIAQEKIKIHLSVVVGINGKHFPCV